MKKIVYEKPYLDFLDFLDFLDGVYYRDSLLVFENLSSICELNVDLRERLVIIDKLYRQNVEPYKGLINRKNKNYYPIETYWWYYKKPYYLELEPL